jgi:hypothetical protein
MRREVLDLIDDLTLKIDYIKSYGNVLENCLPMMNSSKDNILPIDISYANLLNIGHIKKDKLFVHL